MKRFASIVLAAMMVLMTLTGCAGSSTDSPANSDAPTYGVVCQAMNSEYWLGFAQGAKEGAENVGVNVLVNGRRKRQTLQARLP